MEKLLKKIARALNNNKIDYIIIGGQALLAYGYRRFTNDIDIALEVDISYLGKIKNIIRKLNLEPIPTNIEKFVKKTYVLPVLDRATRFVVDFIFTSSGYETTAIKRAIVKKIDSVPVNFASLEDLIIYKIISSRAIDMEDIKALLFRNKKVDEKYIIYWLKIIDSAQDTNYAANFQEIIKYVRRL